LPNIFGVGGSRVPLTSFFFCSFSTPTVCMVRARALLSDVCRLYGVSASAPLWCLSFIWCERERSSLIWLSRRVRREVQQKEEKMTIRNWNRIASIELRRYEWLCQIVYVWLFMFDCLCLIVYVWLFMFDCRRIIEAVGETV
jgi:hypothetical protein